MIKICLKTSWLSWLFVAALFFIITHAAFANLPEPETYIYGQVFNQYQNNKILLTDAQITFDIRKKGCDQMHSYQGTVECTKCQTYDDEGLNCLTCEDYSYIVKIPQESESETETCANDILPLLMDNQQYDLIEATVNGVSANMDIKSQSGNVLPDDKEGKFILAGQPRRSHYYEIDLKLVLPVTDTDNDSLPDFWEKQYHLNLNDASDAIIDTDNDGWNNLKEFFYATNPVVSNVVPSLLESSIIVFEGAKTLFQLNIADSDTPQEELSIKFVSIPDSIRFVFHGENKPFSHGHVIRQNEIIQFSHLLNGNVILEYLVPGNINDRIYILLIDGDHDPVIENITIQTYKPTATDATDAILWADAFYHAHETDDTVSKRLQDRSGHENRANYYTQSQEDGYYSESDIQVEENSAPSGNPAIHVQGYFELPYATPVFPQGNVTMMSVFKVKPSEKDQTITSGSYFAMVVAGEDDPLHPGELKIADESTAVYSNKRIENEWVLASINRKDGKTTIDINSIWTGGPFTYDEITELPNDPSIGGKNIWKWDFNQLEWIGNADDIMDGLFGEMLVYDRPLSYMEKWRIYAHLRGKWFGDVISDCSQATRDMQIMAISGKRGEIVREQRAEADRAWMAYSDAVFANENVLQVLAQLELLLPDNWQWKTTPPSVDEAREAIDLIKYNYQEDFVSKYGKDRSYLLIGGMGNDTIIGGYENDILIGGAGSNTLKGCGGQDIFVVNDADEIIDFNESDNDVIDISHLLNNTNHPLEKYIHFELVNDLEAGVVNTLLSIDSNGLGENFDDARILLHNVTFRDRIDIVRLWGSGSMHTGGAKPDLEISLAIVDKQATELPENFASFEISFSDNRLPQDLTVPIVATGTATIGDDYKFLIPIWNEQSLSYDSMETAQNIIPIRLRPGDQKILIKVIPTMDHVAELTETIFVSLLEKKDYYQLTREAVSSIEISDGLDEISIQTIQPVAYEGKSTGASIVISRNGSFDINKEVSLLIKGTAENGKDCYYIPSEITFAPGEIQSTVNVVAYNDREIEDIEFVEIIVDSGDYNVRGPSSARVEIREPITNVIQGDVDNNSYVDLKDVIIALQICSGKGVPSVIVESAITNDRIGLEEVLFLLNQISKSLNF